MSDTLERLREEANLDVPGHSVMVVEKPVIRALLDVAEAAQTFIDTMAIRHSDTAGREIPAGFTAASGETAVALFDALASLDSTGGAERVKFASGFWAPQSKFDIPRPPLIRAKPCGCKYYGHGKRPTEWVPCEKHAGGAER